MDAPRGSVELEEAELERLRRRAYGPDADIAGDEAAQARLSELEAAQRRQQSPVRDATASASAPVPERFPVPEPVEGPRSASTTVLQPDVAFAERGPAGRSVNEPDFAGGPIADSDPIDGAATAPWWRRPRWLAIFGGAIAALAVIAVHLAWMSQLLADESTPIPTETATAEMPRFPAGQARGAYAPAPDYVLALKSDGVDADHPNDLYGTLDALGLSRDELKRYEDFQDPDLGSLNIWSGESRFGITCLFVAHPGQGIRNGFSADGCSLKGLDTIVDVQKGSYTLTRFVLRGDEVNVYVYDTGADPNAPQG